ncbi:MAG: MFS transporter [Gammaproteobacteria bacterium]|nr:MFS transporter [Gammaproteobacteria bacterium]
MIEKLGKRQVALRLLLPFAFGYFLSYLYRTINAVLSPDLVAELGLAADDLGLLTATYFITFGAAQLPLGILLDRYGPRKVEALLLSLAAVGALLFALGSSMAELIVGRGLIGLGVSACLMAAFKGFTLWFPPARLPLVNGLIMAAGGLGALTATAPVEAVLTFTDWRGVFMLLAGLTLVCALTIFLLVPNAPAQQNTQTLGAQLRGIERVFSDRFFWRVAPLAMLSQSSFISVQSLWAGPWLRDVGGLARADAAELLLLVALAMTTGFLAIGAIAERLSRLGIAPATVSAGGMSLFMLAQLGLIIVPTGEWVAINWLLFGFFGTSGIVQYASLSQHFERELAGRVNTSINLLVFVSAFCLQWSCGEIIALWGQQGEGAYATASYQAAFAMLLMLQLLALAWFLWSRERGPGQATARR